MWSKVNDRMSLSDRNCPRQKHVMWLKKKNRLSRIELRQSIEWGWVYKGWGTGQMNWADCGVKDEVGVVCCRRGHSWLPEPAPSHDNVSKYKTISHTSGWCHLVSQLIHWLTVIRKLLSGFDCECNFAKVLQICIQSQEYKWPPSLFKYLSESKLTMIHQVHANQFKSLVNLKS